MTKPRASTAVDCHVCSKTIGRKADLPRHMKTHAINKEELMHTCPYLGCTYQTLQRSNLATHLNVHSRERPNKCPADGCDFSSSDPGSLTRHRKEVHGYEPKANSGNHPSAIARKAARRQRRISPYTSSSSTSPSSSGRSVSPYTTSSSTSPSSSGHSVSPLDPSSSVYFSLGPDAPLSLLADAPAKNGTKNISAAYSTELITKLLQVNDSAAAPNPEPENSLPPTLGLLTTPEAPTVEYPQLPAPSLPSPVIQYMVNNLPAPTPVNHPSYEYTVENTPYGYPTEALSFDTPFSQPHSFDALFSQPYSFVAPDMGVYPQSVDLGYFYAAPAATTVLPMQEFYLY